MSETLNKLKEDFLKARIEKDVIKSRLLSCIIGDIEAQQKRVATTSKETLEEKVNLILKQFLKKTDEFLTILENSGNSKTQVLAEKIIVESYLPKQLSKEELRAIILTNIDAPIDIPTVMKYLKNNHSGCYDGKLASQVVKEIMEGSK